MLVHDIDGEYNHFGIVDCVQWLNFGVISSKGLWYSSMDSMVYLQGSRLIHVQSKACNNHFL